MATPQVGFPSELSNDIQYSVPAGVTAYQVKVVPSNVSQVQTTTQSVPVLATATAQLNGTSSNVIFDIPCQGSPSTFVDYRFSTLNFRATYEVVAANAATTLTAQLRSSAYAHFDRCYITGQEGQILDDVPLVGLVQDSLIQLETNVADRDALSAMYGFQYEAATANSLNSNQGHKISNIETGGALAAGSSYYSYSMPLLSSLIGKGARKFFQIGATSKLQLVLQTAAIVPLSILNANAGGAPTIRVTLDNFSINLAYVDIGPEGLKMLNKTGIQYYDGITYRVSSATLPAATGAVSLLTGIRGSSVRSIWSRFNENSLLLANGCCNSIYDSKMPVATSIAYNVNGQLVPPNPVDLVHAPATAFSMVQESNSSFDNYSFKSSLVPSQFFKYTAAALPADADQLVSAAGLTSTVANLCQFLFGQNLEKISKYGILDGMNMNSGNTFLNMVLSNAPSQTLTVFFIAKMDIIYVHDLRTGSVTSRL